MFAFILWIIAVILVVAGIVSCFVVSCCGASCSSSSDCSWARAVGGVVRVVPLTGITLPFVSYGGSSILANFVGLALLVLVSHRARITGETT